MVEMGGEDSETCKKDIFFEQMMMMMMMMMMLLLMMTLIWTSPLCQCVPFYCGLVCGGPLLSKHFFWEGGSRLHFDPGESGDCWQEDTSILP